MRNFALAAIMMLHTCCVASAESPFDIDVNGEDAIIRIFGVQAHFKADDLRGLTLPELSCRWTSEGIGRAVQDHGLRECISSGLVSIEARASFYGATISIDPRLRDDPGDSAKTRSKFLGVLERTFVPLGAPMPLFISLARPGNQFELTECYGMPSVYQYRGVSIFPEYQFMENSRFVIGSTTLGGTRDNIVDCLQAAVVRVCSLCVETDDGRVIVGIGWGENQAKRSEWMSLIESFRTFIRASLPEYVGHLR